MSDFVVSTLASFAGTLAVILLGLSITWGVRRPKLRLIGGLFGESEVGANIRNQPGLLGVRFRPPSFGRWRPFPDEVRPFGIPVERIPAKGCHALLYSDQAAEPIGLMWEHYDGTEGASVRSATTRERVTLADGEAQRLMILARDHEHADAYVPWTPHETGADVAIFDRPQVLKVTIRSGSAATLTRFRVFIVRDKHGHLTCSLRRPKR